MIHSQLFETQNCWRTLLYMCVFYVYAYKRNKTNWTVYCKNKYELSANNCHEVTTSEKYVCGRRGGLNVLLNSALYFWKKDWLVECSGWIILDIQLKTIISLLGFGVYRILEFIIYHVRLCFAFLNSDISNQTILNWYLNWEGGSRAPVYYF